MTIPLLMLRAVQLGISVGDFDKITFGELLDIQTESANDLVKDGYTQVATQEDFDRF